MDEYDNIVKSLENYDIPEKKKLAKLIFKEVQDKKLEDIIWDAEGGNSRPMAFYYNDGWHEIDGYNGGSVLEVVRKANGPWVVREAKYLKKEDSLIPEQNWMISPSEETRVVRDSVSKAYYDLFKVYPYFEVTLYGSAFNGSMHKDSNLDYSLIIDEDKMKEDEIFKGLYEKELEKANKKKVENPEEYAYSKAKNAIARYLRKEFFSSVSNIAKENGINLKEGKSYVTYISKDKVENANSKDNHLRLIYTVDHETLSGIYVDYNIYIKYLQKKKSNL